MAYTNPNHLREAIAALIATVPGSGKVHTRRRIVRSDQDMRRLHWDDVNQRICAWMISPRVAGMASSVRNPGYVGIGQKGGGNVMTTFGFQIEGIFQLDDTNASEEVFTDLAWAVADEFNAYGIIPAAGGGAIPGIHLQGACEIAQFGFIAFAGSALCHYARLELTFTGRTRG